MRSGHGAVRRRRGPYQEGRSWTGLSLTGVGALVGAVLSLAALAVGVYALAYAEGSVRLGGHAYGCTDMACTSGHTLAGMLCLVFIAVYLVLAVLALASSRRMLRMGMRLALIWAAVVVVVALLVNTTIGWLWLAALAVSPLLMGWGSRQRLRARERQLQDR